MVRISKKNKRRMQSPRRPRLPSAKTGAKKDNLSKGFKEHENGIQGELAGFVFIPKIKSVK